MISYLDVLAVACRGLYSGVSQEAKRALDVSGDECFEFCKSRDFEQPEKLYLHLERSSSIDEVLHRLLEDEGRVTAFALNPRNKVADATIKALRQAFVYLRSQEAQDYRKLARAVSESDASLAVKRLMTLRTETVSADEYKQAVATASKYVYRLIKVKSPFVPLDRLDEAREAAQGDWQLYLKARSLVTAFMKDVVQDLAKAAPEGFITAKEANDICKENHLPAFIHRGFDGLIGQDGFLYTKEGVRIVTQSRRPVRSIDHGAVIIMNSEHQEGVAGKQWVFKAVMPTKSASGQNNVQMFYTDTHRAASSEKKFSLVDSLLEAEAELISRWRKDLRKKTFSQEKVFAAMCEIAYWVGARVGGVGNATKDGATYGITTWLRKHVKIAPSGAVTISYVGKSGVAQVHKIKPDGPDMTAVVDLIKTFAEGKTPSQALWSKDGVVYGADQLRRYFKSICPVENASPHKLRHMRGTSLAKTFLMEATNTVKTKVNPVTQAAVNKVFKDAMTEVGKSLGHYRGSGESQAVTWATAVSNYIDPTLMRGWYSQYENYGVRVPTFIPKTGD